LKSFSEEGLSTLGIKEMKVELKLAGILLEVLVSSITF